MLRAVSQVTLPHRFDPRPYQLPLLAAMDSGVRRAVQVWHRRSGKEKVDVNIVAKKMMERVGTYYYCFPEFAQGRKVLWDGADKDGFRFIDHFPYELLDGPPNNTEMKLRYRNGSLLQVIGSDRYDAVLGTNPIGMVFSEYSLSDPACWGYFRPILAENGGWAIFNFTPRGENHAYDLWTLAGEEPAEWFRSMLTVKDTQAIPEAVLAQERKEILRLYGSEALYLQEYMCSFTVPVSGAYYAEQIAQATRDGRIGRVPHEPTLSVDTWWDLGMNDRTAIWFVQHVGAEIRLIDYMEGTGKGIPDYIADIRTTRPQYALGRHIGPHDLKVRDLSVAGGKTRQDVARALGFDFDIAPSISIADGIDAARALFSRCRFDREKAAGGLNALKSYRKAYDEKRKTYASQPLHDWSSNGSDAFRYGALVAELGRTSKPAPGRDGWAAKAERRTRSAPGGAGVLG